MMYRRKYTTFLLAYFVWSWSAFLASATWWLLTVPPTNEREQNRNSKVAKAYCDSLRFLKDGQHEYCTSHPTLMHKISEGVKSGIRECQYQFRHSRWNCSTYDALPRHHAFKPIVKSPSREAAYVHAIIAASVSYEVTRACSGGDLPDECACAKHKKSKAFNWGGCSDDIKFGDTVSQTFLDSDISKTAVKNKLLLHNNEAGRRAIRENDRTVCKCHGLSGACTQTVCWKTMPPLRLVSRLLKNKFDGAILVKAGKRNKKLRAKVKNHKNPTSDDLVYSQSSRTDFCDLNLKHGSYGTQQRLCNSTSSGTDGCGVMCCDRGHVTKEVTKQIACNCTFEWCCKLNCQICSKTVTESRCT